MLLRAFELLYKPGYHFDIVSQSAEETQQNLETNTASDEIVNRDVISSDAKYRFCFAVLEYNPHASDYGI